MSDLATHPPVILRESGVCDCPVMHRVRSYTAACTDVMESVTASDPRADAAYAISRGAVVTIIDCPLCGQVVGVGWLR
jgi:hypothetical protein